MLKNWLIFVKEPMYKQAEVAVDLKTARIKHFLFSLQANYFDNKEIKLKKQNIELFLSENSKVIGYYKIKTNIAHLR